MSNPWDERQPHPEAVKRIARHLLGEDIVNIRAAVESFPNGYTVVPKEDKERVTPSDIGEWKYGAPAPWRRVR